MDQIRGSGQSVENEHSSSGEFEIDESYFGAKRVRGKRGRGAAGKTPVFGLLKRNGQVYVQVVEGINPATRRPIIAPPIVMKSGKMKHL